MAVYTEPVRSNGTHYADITVDGVRVAGTGDDPGVDAYVATRFGGSVLISWGPGANPAVADPPSTVGFTITDGVTDTFENPLANPGRKFANASEQIRIAGPDGGGDGDLRRTGTVDIPLISGTTIKSIDTGSRTPVIWLDLVGAGGAGKAVFRRTVLRSQATLPSSSSRRRST